MSDDTTVSKFLGVLCGLPVRVTILEPDSRERILCVAGTLSKVGAESLTVECTRSVPPLHPDVIVSIEVTVNGSLIWFNTTLSNVTALSGRGQVTVALPETVETLQRRSHPRVHMDQPIRLLLQRTGEGMQARVRDLSAVGAALRTRYPVSVGHEVILQFPLASGMFFGDPVAVTLRCADAEDGQYNVAVQFIRVPEQEARIAAWVSNRIQNES